MYVMVVIQFSLWFLHVFSVGSPILTVQNASPSQEEIDIVHHKYVQQLTTLFDEHKTKFGVDENIRLEII